MKNLIKSILLVSTLSIGFTGCTSALELIAVVAYDLNLKPLKVKNLDENISDKETIVLHKLIQSYNDDFKNITKNKIKGNERLELIDKLKDDLTFLSKKDNFTANIFNSAKKMNSKNLDASLFWSTNLIYDKYDDIYIKEGEISTPLISKPGIRKSLNVRIPIESQSEGDRKIDQIFKKIKFILKNNLSDWVIQDKAEQDIASEKMISTQKSLGKNSNKSFMQDRINKINNHASEYTLSYSWKSDRGYNHLRIIITNHMAKVDLLGSFDYKKHKIVTIEIR